MQTFSYLQRSGHDEKNFLKGFLFAMALWLYEPLTTIYPYLPIFLGVAFWRLFIASSFKEKAMWLLYLYFFQIDHTIPLVVLIVAVVGSYYLLRRLLSYLICGICIRLLGVLLVYTFFMLALIGFFWMLQIPWHPRWEIFWLYLVVDMVIVGLYA